MTATLPVLTPADRDAVASEALFAGYFERDSRIGFVYCPLCGEGVTGIRALVGHSRETFRACLRRAMVAHLETACEEVPRWTAPR